MKKRNTFNFIVEILLTLALTIGLISYAANVCERKTTKFRFHDFFENKEEYDVVFYGSSHMINGVFPNNLYRDYGISAYNFGAHADYLPSTYWVMRNSFDYVNPKLVVIDCYTISEQFKVCSYEFWHDWIDGFKLSRTKIEAVRDLSNDPLKDKYIAEGTLDASAKGTTAEMVWDFCKYHSRWTELDDEDFVTSVSTEKGAEARVNIFPMEDTEKISKGDIYTNNTAGTEYLNKMIAYCKERNIEVLLVYIPFAARSDRQQQANRAGEIAGENGVNYINFLEEDLVDYSLDFYDDTHLNTVGAAKVTDYIGKYIKENYDIPDRSSDPSYAVAYDEYEKYRAFKMDAFEREESIHGSLLYTEDSDFDAIIEIMNASFWEDEINRKFLERMGIPSDFSEDGTGCIAISGKSNIAGIVYELPSEYTEYEENDDNSATSSVRIYIKDPYNNRIAKKEL